MGFDLRGLTADEQLFMLLQSMGYGPKIPLWQYQQHIRAINKQRRASMGDMVGKCQHGDLPAYCPECLADRIEDASLPREVGQIVYGAQGVIVAALRFYALHNAVESSLPQVEKE